MNAYAEKKNSYILETQKAKRALIESNDIDKFDIHYTFELTHAP